MSTSAGETYAKRICMRLGLLCDYAGMPSDLYGRSSALAAKMDWPASTTIHMLSGDVAFSWDQLEALCTVFSKEPGYFLNEDEASAAPDFAPEMVTGFSGGIAAWQPPGESEFFKRVPGRRLGFVQSYAQKLFANARAYTVYEQLSDLHPVPGESYVLGTELEMSGFTCLTALNDKCTLKSWSEPGLLITLTSAWGKLRLEQPVGDAGALLSGGRVLGGIHTQGPAQL